jgi:hypothetical protein
MASNFRTVSAVWDKYVVSVQHFEQANSDATRNKKDNCIYESVLRKVSSIGSTLDTGLLCGAVLELVQLSLDLQECAISTCTGRTKR